MICSSMWPSMIGSLWPMREVFALEPADRAEGFGRSVIKPRCCLRYACNTSAETVRS